MGYEVGYSNKKNPQPCSRKGCAEGGKLLKGQLRFTTVVERNDGNAQRKWQHLACASKCQKQNVQKKCASANELIGYDTLTVAAKALISQLSSSAFHGPRTELTNGGPTKNRGTSCSAPLRQMLRPIAFPITGPSCWTHLP